VGKQLYRLPDKDGGQKSITLNNYKNRIIDSVMGCPAFID
jgi:hypothetical protein